MKSDLLADIWTVTRKEGREWYVTRTWVEIGALAALLIVCGLAGQPLAQLTGMELTSLVVWLGVPLLVLATFVGDIFAGERERHTLETLLSTRLSVRAIVIGKVTAAALYGWILVILTTMPGLLFASPALPRLAGPLAIALGLALSLLIAFVGALCSLRSPTARQAHQLTVSFVAILFVVVFALLVRLGGSAGHMSNAASMATAYTQLVGILLGADLLLLLWLVFSARRVRLFLAK
ncbi:MAG: hypothetical protein H3C34_19650 [Caldilineaceae bacterium]|nr:hypothetical protein [Caldilineaceae bacterium]